MSYTICKFLPTEFQRKGIVFMSYDIILSSIIFNKKKVFKKFFVKTIDFK